MTLQAQERHEALVTWRAWAQTGEFKILYAHRAGIEGTMSVGVRSFGMPRSRYFGFKRQHIATASAMNLLRVVDRLAEKPRALTSIAAFERVVQMLLE